VPRTHAGKQAETERVLRIDGGTRIPAFNRQRSSDELTGRKREGWRSPNDHKGSIGTETAHDGRHRVSIRYRCENHLGATKFAKAVNRGHAGARAPRRLGR